MSEKAKDRIRISDLGSYYLSTVKRNLGLQGQPNYVPMRIAFGRSIQLNKEPVFEESDTEVIEKSKKIRGGEQPSLSIFEQGQGLVFKAILTQKYKRKIDGDDYADLLTKHIEHGLWVIAHETEKLKGYDYIIAISSMDNMLKKGQEAQTKRSAESPVLAVSIGKIRGTDESVIYEINKANNPHFGVMGIPGSGKTYFLKHLLKQNRQQSKYDTHFIVFDYKDGDIASDADFVRNTHAEVIDLKRKPLPLNVFAGAEKNEKEQVARAEQIVEIVQSLDGKVGSVQGQNLYDAIKRAYQYSEPYPDFQAIRESLEIVNPKTDSLTSFLRPLIDQHYFANADEFIYGQWTNRTLVIDIHQIERKDVVVFFVLSQVHRELKKLGVAPVDENTGARQIRTVIVIDEAHYFLAKKKQAKILENMIRDIRSSGGAVILASQSPDDYDKAEFDFLELMEFPIVLKSNPKSKKFLEQKFGITSQQAQKMLPEVGKLDQGQAYVMYGKKPVVVDLCK